MKNILALYALLASSVVCMAGTVPLIQSYELAPGAAASNIGIGGVVANMLASGVVVNNLGFTPLNPANNLSDVQSLPLTLTHLGIGTPQGGYNATTGLGSLANANSGTSVSLAIGTKTVNYTATATDSSLIFNCAATCTLTLPAASSNLGLLFRVRNITAFSVVSATANIAPLAGGSATTAILPATAGKWVVLQSDGANYQIMSGN